MNQNYNTLLFDVDEAGIATVIINRPDKLNALNNEVLNELSALTEAIEKHEKIGGLIITGAGEKAFVAGADIKEINFLDEKSGYQFSQKGQQIFQSIEDLRIPVIAAVNGFALGGGAELAMACHLRIAGDDAKFGLPEVGLGLIPGYGGTQRLTNLVGKSYALELILSGMQIDAERALKIGLVNRVDPNPALEAHNILRNIMKNGPLAVKKAMKAISIADGGQGFEKESELFGMLCPTADAKEGTAAFLEKRKPEFKGK